MSDTAKIASILAVWSQAADGSPPRSSTSTRCAYRGAYESTNANPGSFDETQVEPAEPFGVGEDVHRNDPPAPDRKGSNRKGFAVLSRCHPNRTVDPRQLHRQAPPGEGNRLAGDRFGSHLNSILYRTSDFGSNHHGPPGPIEEGGYEEGGPESAPVEPRNSQTSSGQGTSR
jgi:hypothetical protein